MAKKNDITYARLSIPEEKAYLFETEVPVGNLAIISQNIEFKLEENIPLSAKDTVFTFDLLGVENANSLRASVSAVPKTYIEHMISIFSKAGIIPIAFETTPRAIARIISSAGHDGVMVVHSMKSKTGIYVISEHAIGFTSTIGAGSNESDPATYTDTLASEIHKVYSYWAGRNDSANTPLTKVMVVGHDAESVANLLRSKVKDLLPVEMVNVWHDVFDTDSYVPPILKEDSFEYVTSAGLAL
jgi:hypothetical protein